MDREYPFRRTAVQVEEHLPATRPVESAVEHLGIVDVRVFPSRLRLPSRSRPATRNSRWNTREYAAYLVLVVFGTPMSTFRSARAYLILSTVHPSSILFTPGRTGRTD